MIKTFILLTNGWDGMPIAFHLKQEGFDVMVGQVQNKSELGIGDDKEKSEDKEARLKQYNGMLDKMPARKLVDALKKVANKDEYFIYCDQNSLFKYAEELLDAGFTNGIFPTQKDFDFEKDREAAMSFVEEHYPDIKIVPFQEFATVDEAKEYLEENEGVYVVQSKGDFVSTVVPTSDDPEQAKTQVLNQLEKNKKDYEKGGIIIKEKLINPVEITPQIVFYNGEVVFTDIDIETKNIGDGQNNGNQVGCGTNLIIKTELSDKINDIAFPPIVQEMAKEHTGLFVWDISLYIMPDGIYFGEFCSNRFGYDAVMTEMTMAGGAGKYFNALVEAQNPLQSTFGVATRVFNLTRKEDTEISFDESIKDYVWLYEIYEKAGSMLSLGDCWDLGVITCAADKIEDAIEMLYDYVSKFSFKESYTRTKTDFMDIYPTSILERYAKTNHEYFETPDIKMKDQDKHKLEMEKLKNSIKTLDMKIESKSAETASHLKEMHEGYKQDRETFKSTLTGILNGNS